ncbi:GGDEF domain-containing protein, partial [Spirochaetota bacterium]
IRNIHILTHLLKHDAVDDEIIENLRKSELDYFSLIDKYKILEQKVNIDEKTSLLKFRKEYLTNIIKTASRIFYGMKSTDYNISFVRIDIDDFSVFNNQYGHELGDEVLIKIANVIKENSRPTDYVIRFGGEEFDSILPATDVNGAEVYIKKILDRIMKLRVEYQKKSLKVSVSAGITGVVFTFNDKHIENQEIERLFHLLQQQADNALYEAKYLGKAQYAIYMEKKKQDYAKIRKKYVQK